jgi:hypothetical protein
MGFSGWAPEVINGRLAQIGFLAALGTEALNPGEKLADQFVDNFPLFAGSVLAVVVASFAPEVYRQNVGEKKVEYTADPKSIDPKKDPFGIFKESSEMTNSRAAMVGIAAMLLTEQLLQRPVIMFGMEGKAMPADTELNERLSAWAADAGADLVADEDKVAMLFMSGKVAPTLKKAATGKKAPAKSSGGLFLRFRQGRREREEEQGARATLRDYVEHSGEELERNRLEQQLLKACALSSSSSHAQPRLDMRDRHQVIFVFKK